MWLPESRKGERISWHEFYGFPNFPQANAGTAGLNSTGQCRFILNPFQFILRQSFYYYTLFSLRYWLPSDSKQVIRYAKISHGQYCKRSHCGALLSNRNILVQTVSLIIWIKKCLHHWLYTTWSLICHCREIVYIACITEQTYENIDTSAKEWENEKPYTLNSFMISFFA